jgi:hypothetical protein
MQDFYEDRSPEFGPAWRRTQPHPWAHRALPVLIGAVALAVAVRVWL